MNNLCYNIHLFLVPYQGPNSRLSQGSGVSAMSETKRTFDTGATRDLDTTKYDYDGFLSPLAIEAFGAYMHFNRHLPDGTIRASDNWQLGIPTEQYIKSGWRHWLDLWRGLRGWSMKECLLWAACGVMFNVQGIMHNLVKDDADIIDRSYRQMLAQRDAPKLREATTHPERNHPRDQNLVTLKHVDAAIDHH